MKLTKAQRTMLLVGLLPLLAVVVGGAAVTVGTIRGKLPYSYSAAFTPGADGVQIKADVPTQIEASLDGQVHVTVDGTYTAQRPDVQVASAGRQLVVQATCPDSHCHVDLVVEVPAVAAVKAKIEGTTVNVAGLSSPLAVDVSDGSVDLARVRSTQVSVDVRRGSISMAFDAPPDQLAATASDGSITLQLPRTTNYAIDAVAAQGSTHVAVPNDASASHHVYLRTSYGSITVQ
ncbi:DUF4097 family beta strand repeat-containing protein [Kribbella sp. NPDC048928]|uniref:DUF4097 family beta strand repeat-containing protein n=1 Tax=Kribbella sp. NPDC048928 TaxID=3364111 RepID=UPI0037247EF9